MSSKAKKGQAADERPKRSSGKPSKKDQIISLFLSGMGEVEV